MKTTLAIGLISGIITLCHGTEKLIVSIELPTELVTSESVPLQVVFTNTSNRTIVILRPVLGRDLVIRVYDKTNVELARSGIPVEYIAGYGVDDKKEYISLKPREAWKTDSYNLFEHVYPSDEIVPDQTVRVSAIYTLKRRDYEGRLSIDIPAHDLEIKSEYIPADTALALAKQELADSGFMSDAIKGIAPTIQCINGIYRIIYYRPPPYHSRGGSKVIVKIDALTGKTLQTSSDR